MNPLKANLINQTSFVKNVVILKKNNTQIEKIELIDPELKDKNLDCRYEDLDYKSVAFKCVGLFLYNPIHLVLKMVYNLSMLGFDFVDQNFKFAYLTIFDFYSITKAIFKIDIKIIFLSFKNIIKNYVSTRYLMTKYWIDDGLNFIKAPVYAVAIQVLCIFTLIYPNEGRKKISYVFKNWNNHISRSRDFRVVEDKDKYSIFFFTRVILNRENPYTFYPFSVMQALGSLKDKNVIEFKHLV
jgi:hypothetical protein